MKILSNINKTNFIGKIKEMPFNKKITIKKIILTDLIPTIEEVQENSLAKNLLENLTEIIIIIMKTIEIIILIINKV